MAQSNLPDHAENNVKGIIIKKKVDSGREARNAPDFLIFKVSVWNGTFLGNTKTAIFPRNSQKNRTTDWKTENSR